ncbi:MAG: class I SAM-dependent methyltransferase [Rhabdochlamydiaceae bacterium]|jgi:SAM-dependent methyltransferase
MNQWAKMSERWANEWASPLRPSPEDVAMFKNQLKEGDETLLLGVTQELQPLARIAIDNNPQVIKNFQTHAVLGDWKDLPLPFETKFDAIIGDGCLNIFQGSPELFFQQVKKALKPNGCLILRVFISPEYKEDLQTVLKEKIGFHAYKWKVAQAVANPYVPVKTLYEVIQPVWDHPTLEVYQNSDHIYYFPKLSELPPWDHIQFGSSYELAERCPVITWKFNN